MATQKVGYDIELGTNSTKVARQIEKDLEKVDKSLNESTKEIRQFGDETKKTEARIAASTGKIDRRFKKTAKEVKAANDSFSGLSGGATALKKNLAGFALIKIAAVFAGISLAVVSSIKVFKEFDQSLQNLSAITGATGEDLKFYSDAAREMGAVTSLSASEVAQAFQLVASAKPDLLSSKEALKEVTKEAIVLAEAAGISVPEAANVMASALNQFGAEADQASKFTDVLAAGTVAGAASISEMGEALKFSGVIASSFGLTFQQTNAAIQLFSTNAIKGGEAGTQLRGVLLGLETKTADLRDRLGVELRPSVVGLEQAMRNLSDANLTTTESTRIFGSRNLVAGNILAGNVDKLVELTKAVDENGVAVKQAATRQDSLQGAAKRLGSALDELALVIMSDSGLGNALKVGVDWLGEFALGIADVFKQADSANVKAKEHAANMASIASAYEEVPAEQLESSIEKLKIEVGNANKVVDENNGLWTYGAGAADKYAKSQEDAKKTIKSGTSAIAAMTKALDLQRLKEIKVVAKKKNLVAAYELQYGKAIKVVSSLQEEIDALQRTEKEQAIHTALVEAGVEANSAYGESIQEKIEKLFDEKEALEAAAQAEKDKENAAKEAAKESKKASEEIAKAAKKSADEVAKAAEEAAEKSEEAWMESRDGIADFFVDVASNGKDAFSSLFDNFKGMLIRMAAEYAASGLLSMFGFGGSVGASLPGLFSSLAGAAGSTGGGTGVGSIISGASGASSAWSALSGGISGFGANAYYGLSGLGSVGNFAANNIAGAGQSINGFFGSTGNLGADFVTGGLATAGAGIAGNYVGNAIFGDSKHGSTLGTVGGAVGSIWGPLGSAIGSFIGQGLGKLIGGKDRADKTALNVDFATSEITKANNRGHDMDEAANSIADVLLEFSNAIGGSDANFRVRAHGKYGLGFDDETGNFGAGQEDEFFQAAFDKIIEGATSLSDVSKELAMAFEGSSEELVNFVQSLAAVDELVQNNPVEAAMENYAAATEQVRLQNEMSSSSMVQLYDTQVDSLKNIMSAYDGSSLAAEALATGLIATKESAYLLATGVLQLQGTLESLISGSAQSIRDSIKTEKELLESAREERNRLRGSLHTLTSPEEIQDAALRITELNRKIFDSLSDEQQIVQAEKFAEYAERTNEVAQRELTEILTGLKESQEEINRKAEEAMLNASQKQEASSETFLDAAEVIAVAANTLAQAINGSGNYVPVTTGEVS